jgi:hypothetical protein
MPQPGKCASQICKDANQPYSMRLYQRRKLAGKPANVLLPPKIARAKLAGHSKRRPVQRHDLVGVTPVKKTDRQRPIMHCFDPNFVITGQSPRRLAFRVLINFDNLVIGEQVEGECVWRSPPAVRSR